MFPPAASNRVTDAARCADGILAPAGTSGRTYTVLVWETVTVLWPEPEPELADEPEPELGLGLGPGLATLGLVVFKELFAV